MRVTGELTDQAVLRELGSRLQRRRVDAALSQAALADAAGVGKRTLERLEAGHTIDFTTLIRLLRALDLMDLVENFIPESPPSPMALLQGRGKVPRRASARRAQGGSGAGPADWTWKE